MSICANRPEPGATSCRICRCGEEVRAEQKAAEEHEQAGIRPNDQGGRAA